MGWDAIGVAQESVDRALSAHRASAGNDDQTPEQKIAIKHEIAEALVEAKTALSYALSERTSLYRDIDDLHGLLDKKGELKKHDDAYYIVTQDGQPTGDPHCLRCWEMNHQLIHLIRSKEGHSCPICHNVFLAETTPFNLGT